MTWAVVRKDLAVLWASPVPYVTGALFHVVLGVLFVEQLRVRSQAVVQPLFPIAGLLLVAMVPVITMRSLAEEERTGTLDVLLAIPVATGRLVAGKWAAAAVTAIVVAAPAVLLTVLLELWGEPDRGPMVAGFVGLAVLVLALSGIGVLASALTASLPVASMGAFFVSLLLWFSHAGSGAPGGDLLARVSLSERLRGFAGGGIDVGDVVFLVCVAGACLVVATAVLDLRSRR